MKFKEVSDFSKYPLELRVLHLTKKDFIVEYTRGTGKGGQNRNKRETAVRIKHPASGCEAYSCDERSQLQNQRKAFIVLAQRMEPWLKLEHARMLGDIINIEDKVDKMMNPKNLKIEVKEDGKWKEITE